MRVIPRAVVAGVAAAGIVSAALADAGSVSAGSAGAGSVSAASAGAARADAGSAKVALANVVSLNVAPADAARGVLADASGMPVRASAPRSFAGPFHTLSVVASTVPSNGDVNPYGVAVVPVSDGDLRRGDLLVSNFNNSANEQGTGTTIMEITRRGTVRTFAKINPRRLPGPCPGGIGLTTALTVLNSGWVIVGSLPTRDGTARTAAPGCLLVLDSQGHVRETFAGGGINGPWDMTAAEGGGVAELFVTNVLNGIVPARRGHPRARRNGAPRSVAVVRRGTVLRLLITSAPRELPRLRQVTEIGSGFAERTDPAALVIGPTGLGLGDDGTLYVADTLRNRVTAIPYAPYRTDSAGVGMRVTAGGHLNGPLGLAVAPGGDILTVNAGDGKLVETTPSGDQVGNVTLDSMGSPPGAGALFGLAVAPGGSGVYYVDDATNTLDLLH
jgi:hypothetical protein